MALRHGRKVTGIGRSSEIDGQRTMVMVNGFAALFACSGRLVISVEMILLCKSKYGSIISLA